MSEEEKAAEEQVEPDLGLDVSNSFLDLDDNVMQIVEHYYQLARSGQ